MVARTQTDRDERVHTAASDALTRPKRRLLSSALCWLRLDGGGTVLQRAAASSVRQVAEPELTLSHGGHRSEAHVGSCGAEASAVLLLTPWRHQKSTWRSQLLRMAYSLVRRKSLHIAHRDFFGSQTRRSEARRSTFSRAQMEHARQG